MLQAAFAGTLRSIENSSAQEVVDGMANKLARGIANTTTGWLELPKQIAVTVQEEGPTKGLLVGPLKGIGMTLVRTFGGAGEALTFFVAWPGFFDPYIDPPYVWQKE
jgi:putative exosortase-associated protein (TIGR04073 family)